MIYGTDPSAGAGHEYYQIGPLLDWNALGGITVEHSTPLLTCGPQTGDVFPILSTAFVGGVSDGRYGTAAMDTATHNLTALRSYTFLDWGLLGVASEIVDRTTADVWTTLASRLLVGNVTTAFANGSTVTLPDGDYVLPLGTVRWLHADGVVYVPALAAASSPAQTEVLLSAGSRTGTWQSIGAYTGSLSVREQDFASVLYVTERGTLTFQSQLHRNVWRKARFQYPRGYYRPQQKLLMA